jgi:hypothetical protein
MEDKLESLIKAVYQNWKDEGEKPCVEHFGEETIAAFLEGKLSNEESAIIKSHFLACGDCLNLIAAYLKAISDNPDCFPQELKTWAIGLLGEETGPAALEVALKWKDKAWEIINTTGDVLVGLELMPASLLRGRQIKDFKDDVTILKDFKDIQIELKLESRPAGRFNLSVQVKQKDSQRLMRDLRVALLKDDIELESYLTGKGKVCFENVSAAKYTILILAIEDTLATVLIDIRSDSSK